MKQYRNAKSARLVQYTSCVSWLYSQEPCKSQAGEPSCPTKNPDTKAEFENLRRKVQEAAANIAAMPSRLNISILRKTNKLLTALNCSNNFQEKLSKTRDMRKRNSRLKTQSRSYPNRKKKKLIFCSNVPSCARDKQ